MSGPMISALIVLLAFGLGALTGWLGTRRVTPVRYCEDCAHTRPHERDSYWDECAAQTKKDNYTITRHVRRQVGPYHPKCQDVNWRGRCRYWEPACGVEQVEVER